MFDVLSDKLVYVFKGLQNKSSLNEKDVSAVIRDVRVALLDADVALPVVRSFCEDVKRRALTMKTSQSLDVSQQVIKIVDEELTKILGGQTTSINFSSTAGKPTVIMLVGLQGAGKTTLAGKLGLWLKENNHTPMLVAADLQRPNAVDQLKIVGATVGVPVFAPQPGNGIGNPIVVAQESLAQAYSRGSDTIIIDTAGRLAVDEMLMVEAAHIKAAVEPNATLLVMDAMTGQDVINTAVQFNEQVGFDGVVLTKLDGDTRGGVALSVRGVTGLPVMFASNGEKMEDFEVFHPERMASRILDLGDMLTLIEKAEKAFDEKQSEKLVDKIQSGKDFTYEDFLTQINAVRRMGSIGKIVKFLPGMAEVKEQLDNVDDKDLDRTEAIILSMTPAERTLKVSMSESREKRIAKGSGMTVEQVVGLNERFSEMQHMMKTLKTQEENTSQGNRLASTRRKKKKGQSGNPAKRALQEQQDY